MPLYKIWNENTRHKRVHTEQFHLHKIQENINLQGQTTDNRLLDQRQGTYYNEA